FFSTTFGAGSSLGGVGSATFSANGFGVVTFSAVLTPLVSWLNSLAETMSTGSESTGVTSYGRAANDTRRPSMTGPWPTADVTSPIRIEALSPLFHLGHQGDAAEAGRRQPPHHAHHRTVVHLAVAAHIDALVEAAARLGHRLQLGHQLLDLDLAILQENLAVCIDRNRQRLLVLVEALGLRLR